MEPDENFDVAGGMKRAGAAGPTYVYVGDEETGASDTRKGADHVAPPP
jgi:hypothetical protein